jgi:hypothetical protein
MMRSLVIALVFLAEALLTPAQQRPSSLIQKRVTFTLAAHWAIQNQEDSDTLGRIQILIPYPKTENTPHSANVAIAANTLPKEVTIKEVGDVVYGK